MWTLGGDRAVEQHTHLGLVGLLQLLLVEADLSLVLGSQLSQGLSQLALKLLLPSTVNLNHARLVPPLGLTQLLHVPRNTREFSFGNVVLEGDLTFSTSYSFIKLQIELLVLMLDLSSFSNINNFKDFTCRNQLWPMNLIALISKWL